MSRYLRINLIAWEAWATLRRDRGFFSDFLSGIERFGLPIEEILSFFFIPYACLSSCAQLDRELPVRLCRFPRTANARLTAPPIVRDNPEAIRDLRTATIPLEDFFDFIAMLSFYLLVFRYISGRRGRLGTSGSHRGGD